MRGYGDAGVVHDFNLRNSSDQFWNVTTGAWEAYNSGHLSDYRISATQGASINSTTSEFTGSIPSGAVSLASSLWLVVRSTGEVVYSDKIGTSSYEIWNWGTRTLSSFGTLVSDIWSAATRTLSAISDSQGITTLLSRIPSALTITSGKVDVNDKNNFGLSSGERVSIREEIDSNSIKLDATVGSRASSTDLAAINSSLGVVADNIETVNSNVITTNNNVLDVKSEVQSLPSTSDIIDAMRGDGPISFKPVILDEDGAGIPNTIFYLYRVIEDGEQYITAQISDETGRFFWGINEGFLVNSNTDYIGRIANSRYENYGDIEINIESSTEQEYTLEEKVSSPPREDGAVDVEIHLSRFGVIDPGILVQVLLEKVGRVTSGDFIQYDNSLLFKTQSDGSVPMKLIPTSILVADNPDITEGIYSATTADGYLVTPYRFKVGDDGSVIEL